MTRRCAALLALLAFPALAKPPKLTLFIAVDSMGSDLYLRHKPRFKYGFARLANEGALFPQVRYELGECVTAVGHSTLSTGAWPWRHGVVGNRALNRATNKLEPAFADASHPVLEAPIATEDASPQNLLAETMADRLRTATGLKGKAVAISGKGRASVPLAGRLGDAWWFHEAVGKYVTGTWYKKEVPAWVKAFNDRRLPDAYHAKSWELLGPTKDYQGTDLRPYESEPYGLGRTFPHPLGGGLGGPGPTAYSALATSGLMPELQVEFAKAALEGEELGKDDVPDLLLVSFSNIDRVYHNYGPTSWEMQDALLRLDKALGDLLAAAERAAGGKGNLSVVLTSDHGGAYVPEEWAALGLDGARVSPVTLGEGLNAELESRFGAKGLSLAFEEADLYLDAKVLEAKKLDVREVRRAAAAWLSKQPSVQVAVARDDVEGCGELTGLGPALRRSYHPDRGGDVMVVLKPFKVLEFEPTGTSHGSPWTYDAEVPLLLWGRSVRPGLYPQKVRAIDVAPTVTSLLEVGAPAMAEGAALDLALSSTR